VTTLPTVASEPGKKSFWKRPEGITGIVFNVALGAAIFFGWGTIVPFVLAAAVNTLNLIVVSLAAAGIVYVMFDKNFRRFLWYLYRSAMRWVTQFIVDIDPIGILKSYIEKLIEKRTELNDSVAEIQGQRQKLVRLLAKNKEEFKTSLAKLQAAKAQLNDSDPLKARQAVRIEALESKQADRLHQMVTTQEGHEKKYDFIVQALTRYGEVCDDSITDMRNEVSFREQEQEQARSFKKGMSAAFGILKGLPDDQEMYDMALETLEREYTENMGRVENVLDITKNVILQADFNDAASLAKADALLSDWNNSHTILPTKKEQAAITAAPFYISPSEVVQVKAKTADKLFD